MNHTIFKTPIPYRISVKLQMLADMNIVILRDIFTSQANKKYLTTTTRAPRNCSSHDLITILLISLLLMSCSNNQVETTYSTKTETRGQKYQNNQFIKNK
jgi:hypothetical protein